MALIGIDTSGKFGDTPIVIVAAKTNGSSKLIKELREKIRKRHAGVSSRRRIKSTDLTDGELRWFVSNVSYETAFARISSEDFNSLKQKYSGIKNWKEKILAALYYSVVSPIYSQEKIVLDRDYAEATMNKIITYVKKLFKQLKTFPEILVSGDEECIFIADLLAGAIRRKVNVAGKEINKEILERFVENLIPARRPSQARVHPSRSNNI